ncbi:hypothetical protein BSZ39_09965 [Bowdeniella nasicola]|uniref:Uncharacterized protein n=1 Tax=Bowdeniella nasicola TaxID=208480 RepID=A0A1Q5Q0F5_9ACTO|nr:hypothetical protein [Bowdeniella nasicola]OKL53348.1 hypothetical protein BSZ39_09965 [Bowdeniella nasicola]
MLRFVYFGALGMLAAAGLLIASGHVSIAGWVGGVGSALVIATSVLFIHVFATRHEVRASEPQIRSAIAAGRGALVRIDAISETGVIINERHVCALTLTVQPRGGRAFRTIISRRISALEMPQFQPGTTHPAVVLTPDGPETVIVSTPDLLRELNPWLTNLQVPPAESVGDI